MSVSGELPADTNWGRWGPEDQVGALNLIGTEKRLAAAGLGQIWTNCLIKPSDPD